MLGLLLPGLIGLVRLMPISNCLHITAKHRCTHGVPQAPIFSSRSRYQEAKTGERTVPARKYCHRIESCRPARTPRAGAAKALSCADRSSSRVNHSVLPRTDLVFIVSHVRAVIVPFFLAASPHALRVPDEIA